jgi:hypothetical protein
MGRNTKICMAIVVVLAMYPCLAAARTIGHASARGDYAAAVASGNISHPHVIKVIVRSRPHQRVSVNWSMTCSKGSGAGSKSGDFHARTRVKRRLRMPYRRPDDCSVAASAQLDRGGRLRVKLVGH